MKENRVVALLLAGGQGARVQPTCPKQFIEVGGESVLLHTMRAFESHPLVTDIVVVCHDKWNGYVKAQAQVGHISKLHHLVEAGKTSYKSLRNGISFLQDTFTPDTIVLVHDSVRPFVSYDIINANILMCQQKGNAVTGIMSNEAYLVVGDENSETCEREAACKNEVGEKNDACERDNQFDCPVSDSYISREKLMRAQTPITFVLKDLRSLLELASEKGILDSQSLITLVNELHFCRLHIVEGSELNFKITHPQDVDVYRKLLCL